MFARLIKLVAVFAVLWLPKIATAEKPNILWLSVEDIGPHVGCYDAATVKTPSIDGLAARSVTYKHAWSNYPVCAPARTTIITGRYATSLGAGNMRCNAIKPDNVKLLPELMRAAGYYCTNASKKDYNFQNAGKPWDKSSKKAHWKNRPEGKPFFAVFNSGTTHESKIRKRPHKQQIAPATVTLFPYWPDTPEIRRDWAQYLDNIQTMDQWVAKHLADLDKAGVAADTIVVFFGDHGSGMPRHKRYAGDSGMRVPMIVHVPEKWKHLWSHNHPSGSKTDQPMGFIDLAPSMLHVAGAKIPEAMQGISIFSAEQNDRKYVFGFRNRMDERDDVSRSICDGRYVYIRNYMPNLPHGQFVDYQQQTAATAVWKKMFDTGKLNDIQSAFWRPRAVEELYDLQSDPHETKNIATAAEAAAKKNELSLALTAKMKSVVDLDLVPEAELFQWELRTGESRLNYLNKDGFSLDRIMDVAAGVTTASSDLDDPQASIRFWALQQLLSRPIEDRNAAMATVIGMFDDSSWSVQLKAAEVALSSNAHVTDSIKLLMKLADCDTTNYYVAVNALACLDRHRQHLTAEHFQRINKLPNKDKKMFTRGDANLEKILERFVKQ